MKMIARQSQIFRYPCEARNPVTKRRVSPGRKNPTKSPDSANTMPKIPRYPVTLISSVTLSLEKISNMAIC